MKPPQFRPWQKQHPLVRWYDWKYTNFHNGKYLHLQPSPHNSGILDGMMSRQKWWYQKYKLRSRAKSNLMDLPSGETTWDEINYLSPNWWPLDLFPVYLKEIIPQKPTAEPMCPIPRVSFWYFQVPILVFRGVSCIANMVPRNKSSKTYAVQKSSIQNEYSRLNLDFTNIIWCKTHRKETNKICIYERHPTRIASLRDPEHRGKYMCICILRIYIYMNYIIYNIQCIYNV